MLWIDKRKCREVALKVEGILPSSVDEFTDPRYYPPEGEDEEQVARYFFFMVAIDHRTHLPGHEYKAVIDGQVHSGADLLYRLGMKRYLENRAFFSPESMANITREDVEEWLNVNEAKIRDPDVRAYLLRDAAVKLIKLYEGQVMELIKASSGYLYSPRGVKEGLIERLKAFRAYEDPVEKKPFLLFKFLERRGIVKVKDKDRAQIPVDNHLTRIAIRLGLVKVDEKLKEVFLWKREATWEEDIIIRLAVRRAYKRLSEERKIDIMILDDFLWSFGRRVCGAEKPRCNECPLSDVCDAFHEESARMLKEHYYYDTWYY